MREVLRSGVRGDVEWHLLLVLPPRPLSRLCRAGQGPSQPLHHIHREPRAPPGALLSQFIQALNSQQHF